MVDGMLDRMIDSALGDHDDFRLAFSMNNMGEIKRPSANVNMVNARTSRALSYDHEGLLVGADAGDVSLAGARREVNQLSSQQDLSLWEMTEGVSATQNSDGSWRVTLPAGSSIRTTTASSIPEESISIGRDIVPSIAIKLV